MKTYSWMIALGAALGFVSMNAFAMTYDNPSPPPGAPIQIPHAVQGSEHCIPFQDGYTYGFLSLDYTYTYQYTEDTNNDGVNDSDPAWVLTQGTEYNIEFHTQSGPISDECMHG